MDKLIGECQRCLTCCTTISLIFPDTSEVQEWSTARGYTLVQANGELSEWRVPSICPNLEGNACKLHDSHKPKACQAYPHAMVDFWERRGLNTDLSLGKSCGYKRSPS